MKSKIAVKAENINKEFKLYPSYQSRLKELLHPTRKKYHQRFMALKNINFKVNYGEILGIIGKNGSGKSTLLKILAGVSAPTSGSFICNGRVTALLELTAGFNKDLTGIQNIFFLGAIQGISKKEMEQRLPLIIEFADIGDYVYQPVKSYSSGMAVRLAFSININIDPDILIIDEALAVGDLRFQQKCFRKIKEFKDLGKTILFCTHNTNAVKDFCTEAIWINEGVIREKGDPQVITDHYKAFMLEQKEENRVSKLEKNNTKEEEFTLLFRNKVELANYNWFSLSGLDSYGNGNAEVKYLTLINRETNKNVFTLEGGEELKLIIVVQAEEKVQNAGIEIQMNGRLGTSVFELNNHYYKKHLTFNEHKPTILEVEFRLPELSNGQYTFSVSATQFVQGKLQYLHWVHDALLVDIKKQDARYNNHGQMIIQEVDFNLLLID